MLLAIDAGNTDTKFGFWNGEGWDAILRHPTNPEETPEQLQTWLQQELVAAGLSGEVEFAVCASVVPGVEVTVKVAVTRCYNVPVHFLTGNSEIGLDIRYNPPASVGADRVANVLGALKSFAPPLIVVDIGTATTFDAVSREGAYLGGAIMPGVGLLSPALANATAKLPEVGLNAPEQAIGRTTVEALQSGIMHGYAGATDSVIERMEEELGGQATVVATGGLAPLFLNLSKRLAHHRENLTLEGLVEAAVRLQKSAV